MTGQVNLNGAWISYEDWRANQRMKARRRDTMFHVLSGLIVLGMIGLAILIKVM